MYGRNVNVYFPLQPRDTILFLAHLALQSVVSLRMISPELRETIYLTLGIVYSNTTSHKNSFKRIKKPLPEELNIFSAF